MNIPNYLSLFLRKYSTTFIQYLMMKSDFLVVNLPNVYTVENNVKYLVYMNLILMGLLITCSHSFDIYICKKNLHKI